MALVVFDEGDGSSMGRGTLFFVLLIGLLCVIALWAHLKKRKRIEGWLRASGFIAKASLPHGLVAQQSVWRKEPVTRRVFEGTIRGFHSVSFEINQGDSESPKWVSALAIARSGGGSLLRQRVRDLGAELDEISTPGWLIAIVQGANAEQAALEPLLKLLTRESWSGVID